MSLAVLSNPILPRSSPSVCPSISPKFTSYPQTLTIAPFVNNEKNKTRKTLTLVSTKSSSSSSAEISSIDDEWLKKLPDKKKPLYSHSLPCIEAWLKKLGFRQSKEDRAVWFTEKPEWHAQLSLDVTDLYIRKQTLHPVSRGPMTLEQVLLFPVYEPNRYLKSGPGDLEKDVERRFSYALSREDIENALLGGP